MLQFRKRSPENIAKAVSFKSYELSLVSPSNISLTTVPDLSVCARVWPFSPT
jgi:hypothetical protein